MTEALTTAPGTMGGDRPLGAGNEVVMNRPGRSVRILSITAYVAAGLLAAAGVILGLLPRSVAGFDAVCPSVLGHLTGAVTPLQSVADRLASAPCVTYEDQMMALMGILLGSAAVVLIAGSRARRLRSVPPGDRNNTSRRGADPLSPVDWRPGRRRRTPGASAPRGLR